MRQSLTYFLQSSKKARIPGRDRPNSIIVTTTTRSSLLTWLTMWAATSVKMPCGATISIRRGWKTLDRLGYGIWSHSTRWRLIHIGIVSHTASTKKTEKVWICIRLPRAHFELLRKRSLYKKNLPYFLICSEVCVTMRNFCHSLLSTLCTIQRHLPPRTCDLMVVRSSVLSGRLTPGQSIALFLHDRIR